MVRVSRLLAVNGLVGDTTWFTAASRERGRTVHYIGEQILLGHPVSVAPAWDGYEQALRAGLEALGFIPLVVERRLTDGDVTGRPDAIGWLPARVGQIPAGPAILDIKSGLPYASHAIQLALYAWLVNRTRFRSALPEAFQSLPWQRIGLYVRDDGTYRLQHYRDQADFAVATAALDMTHWRLAHGLLKPDDVAGYDDDPDMTDFSEANSEDDNGIGDLPIAGAHLTLVGGGAGDPD